MTVKTATKPATRYVGGRDERLEAEHKVLRERGGNGAIPVLLEKTAAAVHMRFCALLSFSFALNEHEVIPSDQFPHRDIKHKFPQCGVFPGDESAVVEVHAEGSVLVSFFTHHQIYVAPFAPCILGLIKRKSDHTAVFEAKPLL